MDFATTPEQDALVRRTVRFVREELPDRTADNDRDAVFDLDGWRRLADFGVMGWPVPTEYGGAGHDLVTCALLFEALGHACRDNGLLFAVNNHVWAATSYLLAHGSPAQRERFLPGLADGTLVGAHALSEPEAGSDMLALGTSAARTADGYVLTGTKTFISNAPVADLFVLFARTGRSDAPQRDLTAFLVPAGTPGVTIARSWSKSGLRGTPMGEVSLDGAVLAPDLVLGEEGGGYQVFTSTIEWERGFMFASQVGTLRRLVEEATDYAGERRQFGRPIGSFQAVSHRLADLQVRLEAARLMLYRFAWLKQRGRVAALESSLLKLHVSESVLAAAVDAVRVRGARGYLTDFGAEREVRDALAGPIYGGTSDVHRSIIARLTGVSDHG